MKKIALILSILLYASAAHGQVTIENLLSVPFPTELKGSPDGRQIVWIFNDKGIRNVFIATAPEFVPRKLTNHTFDDGLEMAKPTFTPDGRHVTFIEGNSLNGKGEAANPAELQQGTGQTVWIVQTDGGGLRKIADGNNITPDPLGKTAIYTKGGKVWRILLNDSTQKPEQLFQVRGSVGDLRWSPDGRQIAFISDRGDHGFLGIWDLDKKTVQYPDPSVDHDLQPVWSPDGKYIAYLRTPNVKDRLPFVEERKGHPWSIRLLNMTTLKGLEIFKADEGPGSVLFTDFPSATNLLLWGADDKLVFPWEKDGWQHLYSVDIFKKSTARLLTPGAGEVEQMVLTADHSSVIYTTNISDSHHRHIWKVNVAGGQPVQLSKGSGIEWAAASLTSGVAVLQSTATRPGWPGIIQADGSVKLIGANLFPATFPEKELVVPKLVSFNAKDGQFIYGELFLPPGYQSGKKYPALLFLHGGSRRQMLLGFHYMGYYSNDYAMNQYYASKGYIVLAVNYRSGIGYGLNFREALHYGANGASEYQDVLAAGLYLKGRTDVNIKRIGLWGGSYGGFLTAMGLARNSDIFACGVDIHGVHNWSEEEKNWVADYDPALRAQFSVTAFHSSPAFFADGWRSPVLLIHGDDDRNVPFSQTVAMIEKLRDRRVYFEELIIPDEIHDFLLHKTWLTGYHAGANFFEKMMK